MLFEALPDVLCFKKLQETLHDADVGRLGKAGRLKQIVDLASDEKRQIRVNVTADASRINVENLKYMNLGIKHTKMNKLLYSLSKIVTIN